MFSIYLLSFFLLLNEAKENEARVARLDEKTRTSLAQPLLRDLEAAPVEEKQMPEGECKEMPEGECKRVQTFLTSCRNNISEKLQTVGIDHNGKLIIVIFYAVFQFLSQIASGRFSTFVSKTQINTLLETAMESSVTVGALTPLLAFPRLFACLQSNSELTEEKSSFWNMLSLLRLLVAVVAWQFDTLGDLFSKGAAGMEIATTLQYSAPIFAVAFACIAKYHLPSKMVIQLGLMLSGLLAAFLLLVSQAETIHGSAVASSVVSLLSRSVAGQAYSLFHKATASYNAVAKVVLTHLMIVLVALPFIALIRGDSMVFVWDWQQLNPMNIPLFVPDVFMYFSTDMMVNIFQFLAYYFASPCLVSLIELVANFAAAFVSESEHNIPRTAMSILMLLLSFIMEFEHQKH